MQLELLLSNDRRALPSVRAFIAETLRQFPLDSTSSSKLADIALAAVSHAVDGAYPSGESGSIRLSIQEEQGKIEIVIRDYGLPEDVDRLEQQVQKPGGSGLNLFGCPAADVIDEVHWRAFGPDGKALQLVKWLHGTHVADSSPTEAIQAFHQDVPQAPPQNYVIRRMQPGDAVEVSRLMYRAYGGTYFNQDVYFPERIAALNARNAVVSYVAVAEDGSIAGHYALELNEDGPVAECGQAVVDPVHRGRGLLDRLRDAAEKEAVPLNLVALYSDAVAVHTLTQQSNVSHGHHLIGADLGISPKTERFHGLAETLPQRVTCLMYFHWLKPAARRTLYVPARHRAIIAEIYDNMQCPYDFGEGSAPSEHGTLTLKIDASSAHAVVRVEQPGADSVQSVRHAKRELVERTHVEVVYAELPAQHSATSLMAEQLEADGFGFIGVAPHFSSQGDILRLAYLVEPLSREPIKTFDAFGGRLVDYTLAEQSRVREGL